MGAMAPPFPISKLAGQATRAGWGWAVTLPTFDFETYSEAGFIWNPEKRKWVAPVGAAKKGLDAVGSAVYAEHPSTEILSLVYDLKDGWGPIHWDPSQPPPHDLFTHIAAGGLLEAHNSSFEYKIWRDVAVKKLGWPSLPLRQLRCSMAKARASALPGGLGHLGQVLQLHTKKDPRGRDLLKKFSWPRDPTKKDPRTRIRPADDPMDARGLYNYNGTDVATEAEASERIPDLIPQELDYWLADQAINERGVGVDLDGVHACMAVLEQCLGKYDAELCAITGGVAQRGSEAEKIRKWVNTWYGLDMHSLDADAVDAALGSMAPHPPGGTNWGRRVLEIRQLVGSASVKKVFAMARMSTRLQRLCDLFIYHGARTGRDAHADVQPGNLPKAGPVLRWCGDAACGHPFVHTRDTCPNCGAGAAFSSLKSPQGNEGWCWTATPYALALMSFKSLELIEYYFGDALLTISGCIRGLLVAAEGHDLICSDYASIEAVVTAMLSGEQWRIDAFQRDEDIYLHGAASVTGKTYDWYKAWSADHGGQKHPDRNKLGKVAELGLGFGGSVGAWRQFDSTDNFTDDEVKRNVYAWRDASPLVPELWGGQCRGKPWKPTKLELYGLEGMAIAAVLNPGQAFAYRGITWQMAGDALYCRLLSGRVLTYHSPRLRPSSKGYPGQFTLSYWGWNSNPKMGAMGWIEIDTYGGRLAENVIQATARDVMAHAVVLLERAGYPVVLRIHDEIAAEVREGWGSIEEFERIMMDLPWWCRGWPIRAKGGWRGKRFRKD